MSVCPSFCLFVCLSFRPSVHPLSHSFVRPFLRSSVYPFVRSSVRPIVCSSIRCSSICLSSLLNPPFTCSPVHYAAPNFHDLILNSPIDMSELMDVLRSLKDNKAPGVDRVPYEFYKNGPVIFLNRLLISYNYILDNEELPESFSRSIIFPLHKKGNIDEAENYRGLFFMDAIVKIFAAILYNRLSKWEKEHKILSESQAGFRSGYSTVDNIFNLISIVKLSHSFNKKKVYAFFVDFKAAFDKVVRGLLFYKLYNYGISGKVVRILEHMYKSTKAQVWNGVSLSDSFNTTSGVKQGCVLSPLLFSLFINDLEDSLETGLVIQDIAVKVLLYADDIVLLSDEPIKLQRMIYDFEKYCQLWKLEVNLSKSKIMIFQRGGGIRKQTEYWSFAGSSIEVVKKYTYLGIQLTPKLSMTEHFRQRLQTAKVSLNCTWQSFINNRCISHSEKFKLFNAVSRSVLCYGAQAWGFKQYELVEKLQRFFVKKLFYLPQHTPNYAIALETGLSELYIYTLKVHFAYLLRVLFMYKSDRLPHRLSWLVIEKEIYWYESLLELTEKHNITLNLREDSLQDIKEKLARLITAENDWHKFKAQDRARVTVRHGLYDKLNYDNIPSYFRNDFSIRKISLIMKCRCGLINLNASPWRKEGSPLCSLCNLSQEEDLFHFLAVCPVLSEFRLQASGKKTFTESEVIGMLNGDENYDDLFVFVEKAWKFRKFLISEFNS